ncbi:MULTISPECIES: DMT family transporter [unclassified Marinobacter]|jgi:DME family drug/metabolite transporter|uniref:DMT family transporter n=1 Tax=unclassified Marinobacter TaxID=83889 RepID=UPI0003B8628B|nr:MULTISPECIES: EamA family transporter [unclassified Marinobacter]ERP90539.1 membrane protein [Marinobacter sp. ES-1]|tara:strand:- start:9153 stop:10097 length:945 start_codon:yes stop_codon:yes gene_type:complete
MIQGALLIALAALLWATTGIVAKFLFTGTELEAITLGFLRLVVALPFFWLLMRREQKQLVAAHPGQQVAGSSLRSLGLKAFLPLAALGLFQAFYQGSYLLAVDLTGAGIATLISLCLPPVLVAILAAPLLGEKPNLLTVIAALAAIAGTGMLVVSDMDTAGSLRLAGILMALLAAAVYTGFTLTSRYNSAGTPVFTTAFICFATAALLLLPVVAFSGGFEGLDTLGLKHWLMIVYIGVVPTCIGYVSFFSGMKTTPATLSSIIVTLEPLFVALLAWVILGEVLGPVGIAGALILTIAVIVASRYGKSPDTSAEH